MEDLLTGRVDLVWVDVHGREKSPVLGSTGRDLARVFRVYGTPTIVLLGEGGKRLLRIPGALSKKDFMDLLCRYVPDVQGNGACGNKNDGLVKRKKGKETL